MGTQQNSNQILFTYNQQDCQKIYNTFKSIIEFASAIKASDLSNEDVERLTNIVNSSKNIVKLIEERNGLDIS